MFAGKAALLPKSLNASIAAAEGVVAAGNRHERRYERRVFFHGTGCVWSPYTARGQ